MILGADKSNFVDRLSEAIYALEYKVAKFNLGKNGSNEVVNKTGFSSSVSKAPEKIGGLVFW